MVGKINKLINISEINQYLYCSRRLYYLKFYDTCGNNYELKEGKLKHKRSSTRGKWVKNIYLESKSLGIKGKIDVLEEEDFPVPIERKRAEKASYYKNDEYQLAAYGMLLEDNIEERIPYGYIYLYSDDSRYKINIDEDLKNKVNHIIKEIRNMRIDNIPYYVSNLNKCKKCSTRKYCMPKESKILGEKS